MFFTLSAGLAPISPSRPNERANASEPWRSTVAGLALLATLMLGGCAGPLAIEEEWAADGDTPIESGSTSRAASPALEKAAGLLLTTPEAHAPWEPFLLPGKRHAAFEPVQSQGRTALRVQANQSVSILRQRFEPPLMSPGHLSFSWRINGLPLNADLAVAAQADAAVRIVLAFDGDRSRWSARNHRLSDMSRLLTGEPLPYASLVYVWSAKDAPGSVVVNSRTDSIRKLVIDSGTTHVGVWRDHVRDVRADFRQVFGEEPGPLLQVGLMTDTDNTNSRLTAWYGSLLLEHAVD